MARLYFIIIGLMQWWWKLTIWSQVIQDLKLTVASNVSFVLQFRSTKFLWSNFSFQECYEIFGIDITTESNLCCCCQTAQESFLHLFWECSITEAFWNRVHLFFVSVNLIPVPQVLTLCQCLGLKGEKSASLLNHC